MTFAELTGGYGALLSSFVAAQSYFKSRSKLMIQTSEGRDEGRKSYCIFSRIANRSERAIKLSWVHLIVKVPSQTLLAKARYALRYPKHFRWAGWMHARLPATDTERLPILIDPLDSVDFVVPVTGFYSGAGEGERRAKFEAIDALGRVLHSKAFTLYVLRDLEFDDEPPLLGQ